MPLITLPVLYERSYGSVVAGTFGTATPALTVTASQLGGWYAHSLRGPVDMDLSRPARLWLNYLNQTAGAIAAGIVLIRVSQTIGQVDGYAVETTNDTYLDIPANLEKNVLRLTELTADGDPFFPARSLDRDDSVGLRIVRVGNSDEDTWPATIAMLTTLWITYHQNCRWGCL